MGRVSGVGSQSKLAAGTDQRKWRAGTPERHGLLKKKKFAERDQESILSADFLQLYYVPQISKEILFFPWGDFPSILSRFFSSLVKAERLFCRSSTLPRLTSGPQHIGRWMCAPRTARESSPGILAALFLKHYPKTFSFANSLRVMTADRCSSPQSDICSGGSYKFSQSFRSVCVAGDGVLRMRVSTLWVNLPEISTLSRGTVQMRSSSTFFEAPMPCMCRRYPTG